VRRREHTGLEAGRDASGPAAEEEDAHGAVAVARLDEPPRFTMDGFVGGGLRLELVSSFDCVRVSLWCLAVGKVVRSPTSLLSQILPPFSDCGTAACATSQVQTACVGSSKSERPVGPLLCIFVREHVFNRTTQKFKPSNMLMLRFILSSFRQKNNKLIQPYMCEFLLQ